MSFWRPVVLACRVPAVTVCGLLPGRADYVGVVHIIIIVNLVQYYYYSVILFIRLLVLLTIDWMMLVTLGEYWPRMKAYLFGQLLTILLAKTCCLLWESIGEGRLVWRKVLRRDIQTWRYIVIVFWLLFYCIIALLWGRGWRLFNVVVFYLFWLFVSGIIIVLKYSQQAFVALDAAIDLFIGILRNSWAGGWWLFIVSVFYCWWWYSIDYYYSWLFIVIVIIDREANDPEAEEGVCVSSIIVIITIEGRRNWHCCLFSNCVLMTVEWPWMMRRCDELWGMGGVYSCASNYSGWKFRCLQRTKPLLVVLMVFPWCIPPFANCWFWCRAVTDDCYSAYIVSRSRVHIDGVGPFGGGGFAVRRGA